MGANVRIAVEIYEQTAKDEIPDILIRLLTQFGVEASAQDIEVDGILTSGAMNGKAASAKVVLEGKDDWIHLVYVPMAMVPWVVYLHTSCPACGHPIKSGPFSQAVTLGMAFSTISEQDCPECRAAQSSVVVFGGEQEG